MKELLRIEHAEGNRDAGNVLKDYNMEISEGEILYIQGSDGSGIREIASLLAGDFPLFAGHIYIEGEKIGAYNRIKAFEKHFFPISAEGSMIYNLTVAENMEAIRDQRKFMKPYIARKMEKKVNDYLAEKEIQILANAKSSLLCAEEEVLLSILKAGLHEAKLVIFETLNRVFEGTYAEKIHSLMKKLCREGISFIILSSAYSHFAEIATRIQFVYRGRDLKEWDFLSEEVEGLLKSQNPDSFSESFTKKDKETEAALGTFAGLYDYEWGSDKCLWNFLKEVKIYNSAFWEEHMNAPLPDKGLSIYKKVLLIPKESGNLWFENLSIEDNLLMPIPDKIAGSRYGVIHKNRREHVVNKFYDIFQIDKGIKEIGDLSKVQKKLFSIYRFELLRPKTIFLENPYWGMDKEEIMQIRKYLLDMQKRGSRIICCAKSIDEMKEDCNVIIQTDNARNARRIHI